MSEKYLTKEGLAYFLSKLDSRFLGKTAKAADSSKLNGKESSFYLDYNNLSNKPSIPSAQVNSDWNATSGVAKILNKPTIPTALSQLTNDLTSFTIGSRSNNFGIGTKSLSSDGLAFGNYSTNLSMSLSFTLAITYDGNSNYAVVTSDVSDLAMYVGPIFKIGSNYCYFDNYDNNTKRLYFATYYSPSASYTGTIYGTTGALSHHSACFGIGTVAVEEDQFVFGKYNIPSDFYIEIVGGGDISERVNLRTLDYDGNEILKGNLSATTIYATTVYATANIYSNGNKVATETYVNTAISNAVTTVLNTAI